VLSRLKVMHRCNPIKSGSGSIGVPSRSGHDRVRQNQNGSPVYLAFPFSHLLKMKARLCDPFAYLPGTLSLLFFLR
jgi:hypothetical protein